VVEVLVASVCCLASAAP